MARHWILTPDTVQTIIANLDRSLMTLKAAKNYFLAYGVEVKGRTKEQFIKNICAMLKEG